MNISFSLGAAGCAETGRRNQLCGFCDKDKDGNFKCIKYLVPLKKHHKFDEPWRAKVCSEEAAKDADSKIAKKKADATRAVRAELGV